MIDNHIYFGNALNIDPRRVVWRRVMDMNDRSLRNIVIGLGGAFQGVPRETGFDITAASEIMAILCLAKDMDDLEARINRCLVAYDKDRQPVLAGQIGTTGAMLALLKDALMPNLVQTLEGTPTIVHGGPFANIAHGCNSVIATRMAMHLAEWTITEAGFGFDLGAEKFFDIKCASAGLDADAVVLVATIRALKMHGGRDKKDLLEADVEAVHKGLPNLEKHVDSIGQFSKKAIVALNQFANDTPEEIAVVRAFCEQKGIPFAVSNHHAEGGKGALELAKLLIKEAQDPQPLTCMYGSEDAPEDKIRSVAQKIYGANDVVFTKAAKKDLARIKKLGYDKLAICIAKTQNSLSDDPTLRGRPTDFDITVRNIQINAGSGFLVVLTGNILRMPGLPRAPQAERIKLVDGRIEGLA